MISQKQHWKATPEGQNTASPSPFPKLAWLAIAPAPPPPPLAPSNVTLELHLTPVSRIGSFPESRASRLDDIRPLTPPSETSSRTTSFLPASFGNREQQERLSALSSYQVGDLFKQLEELKTQLTKRDLPLDLRRRYHDLSALCLLALFERPVPLSSSGNSESPANPGVRLQDYLAQYQAGDRESIIQLMQHVRSFDQSRLLPAPPGLTIANMPRPLPGTAGEPERGGKEEFPSVKEAHQPLITIFPAKQAANISSTSFPEPNSSDQALLSGIFPAFPIPERRSNLPMLAEQSQLARSSLPLPLNPAERPLAPDDKRSVTLNLNPRRYQPLPDDGGYKLVSEKRSLGAHPEVWLLRRGHKFTTECLQRHGLSSQTNAFYLPAERRVYVILSMSPAGKNQEVVSLGQLRQASEYLREELSHAQGAGELSAKERAAIPTIHRLNRLAERDASLPNYHFDKALAFREIAQLYAVTPYEQQVHGKHEVVIAALEASDGGLRGKNSFNDAAVEWLPGGTSLRTLVASDHNVWRQEFALSLNYLTEREVGDSAASFVKRGIDTYVVRLFYAGKLQHSDYLTQGETLWLDYQRLCFERERAQLSQEHYRLFPNIGRLDELSGKLAQELTAAEIRSVANTLWSEEAFSAAIHKLGERPLAQRVELARKLSEQVTDVFGRFSPAGSRLKAELGRSLKEVARQQKDSAAVALTASGLALQLSSESYIVALSDNRRADAKESLLLMRDVFNQQKNKRGSAWVTRQLKELSYPHIFLNRQDLMALNRSQRLLTVAEWVEESLDKYLGTK